MGLKFNPLTAQFDLTGSGGGGASYIDGEVATYNDLPLDGTAALDSAWLVRSASGVWPVSRKQAGIYIRTATAGSSRDADYTYAGTMPDVFSDAVFTLYDDASTTRTGQFNLGSITAGQNRVLTWPDGNGTIARTSDIPSTFAASAITSGVFDNARINFAAPSAIGGTSAAAGSFTTLSASTSLTLGTSGILSGGTNIIEQRNTTSGQTFRIYNTVSGAADANFERGFMRWSSNVLQIGTEAGGTGSVRGLSINIGTQGAITFAAAGSGIAITGVRDLTVNSSFSVSGAILTGSANILQQINGTNAQAFRIFNTASGTNNVNFERANFRWASNEFIIDAEAGGTGTSLRGIKIGSATSSLLGFYGATPVTQRAAIADATDAATTQARLNDLLAAMRSLGLIAT